MNVKISVVVPTYNNECFISQAIDSILKQTHPAHEIIVVDDGSTDSTPLILKRFEGAILCRRIENSGGPATPRNIGIALSTGEYIAFLDGDDLWFKNKIERQISAISRYPDIGFFCSDFAVRRKYQNFKLKKHFSLLRCPTLINYDSPLKIDPFRLLIKENFVSGPLTVIIKKEITDKVGKFYEGPLECHEDYEYWLRCARVTNFMIMRDCLAYKRTHDTNVTNDSIKFAIRGRNTIQKIIKDMNEYIKKEHLTVECRQSISRNYYKLGNGYFEIGKIRYAFNMYFRALFALATFKNAVLFIWTVSKKLTRLMAYNSIRSKR